MEVFHYVANQLNNEPLFDNDVEKGKGLGALYNVFDASPMSLLLTNDECAEFSFLQTAKIRSTPVKTSVVIEKATDMAVIDADLAHGLMYEHLVWDSPYFDNEFEKCDAAYVQNVYQLGNQHRGLLV